MVYTIPAGDVQFEEQLQRTPYDFKLWWKLIKGKLSNTVNENNAQSTVEIFQLFERALLIMPGSYKLWVAYLEERTKRARNLPLDSPAYEKINELYERALVPLSAMPRLWFNYTKFLAAQGLVTRTRRVYDRALKALPVTLHYRVWEAFLGFAKGSKCSHTAVSVYNRYLKFTPSASEEFLDILKQIKNWKEYVARLFKMVMSKDYVSPNGRSKESMWESLADIIGKHADKLANDDRIDVENILSHGFQQSVDNVGRLWVSKANYYTRLGEFDKAEKIFDEACNTVSTAQDFSLVFDAFTNFHESVINAELEFMDEDDEEDEEEDEEEGGGDSVDSRMDRLQALLDSRELLMNRVLVRRDKNNVGDWLAQTELLRENPQKTVKVFEDAVKSIEPLEACNGHLSTLWISYAKYVEQGGKDCEKVRKVYERARLVEYRLTEELSRVWCENVEFEIRSGNAAGAYKLAQVGTTPLGKGGQKGATICRRRLSKNPLIWSLYLDLEENCGTLDTTRAAYDRAIALKVVSPVTIINYARMLAEKKYFEDSFRAYEKGVALFSFPHVLPIWINYLLAFVERYGDSKIERTRDLFEECCETVPAEDAKTIFSMYANFERQYGLDRHAMEVYDRATRVVQNSDKYDTYLEYIEYVHEMHGPARTRDIYESAMATLANEDIKNVGIKFAEMEMELNDVPRARAILAHASQVCDPRVELSFWKYWREFEIQHGDEDTFKEMLRIQRTAKASFLSTVRNVEPEEPVLSKPGTAASTTLSFQQATEDDDAEIDIDSGED
jgi:pre-mRNA-splicing factor SYF1